MHAREGGVQRCGGGGAVRADFKKNTNSGHWEVICSACEVLYTLGQQSVHAYTQRAHAYPHSI